ncbi:unnamed protein product [Parnassius mnemosyne]|uniref:Chromo domain-containing protein n=1 Tax=Parnassius mnemosyne TaxID=213953 RepID=A0AAV1L6M5_9NEOP
MQSVSKENKNFRFILTVIDTFSKYAWAFPIKTKSIEDASIVERFIRTLKYKLYKAFSLQGNYNWIGDNLNNVIYEYNHTYHLTIGEIPASVNNKSKKRILQRYLRLVICANKPILRYIRNWSTEIFKIRKLQNTIPTTYLIEDTIRGQPILGGFYAQELQKTKNPNIYLVEKVLRRKGNKVLVKWLGLSSSENSWIDKSNIL